MAAGLSYRAKRDLRCFLVISFSSEVELDLVSYPLAILPPETQKAQQKLSFLNIGPSSLSDARQPMNDIEEELRVLLRDRRVHTHWRFLRACQLRRKHRRFSKNSNFALSEWEHRSLQTPSDLHRVRVVRFSVAKATVPSSRATINPSGI